MPPRKDVSRKRVPERVVPIKTVTIFHLDVLDQDTTQMHLAKEFYDKEGILLLSLGDRIDPQKCVYQFLEWILDHLPYKPENRLQLMSDDEKLLHIDNKADWPELVDLLLADSFSTENRKRMEKWGIPHAQFGAPCEEGSFWMPILMMLRQDQAIHKVAHKLIDGKQPVCDINRSIMKLPGKGDEEWLHMDVNPFSLTAANACGELPKKAVSGKVAYAGTHKFTYVPSSHTDEFIAELTDKYPCPEKDVCMYQIPKDMDAMDLFDQQVSVKVPPGHMIFWAENVHGVLPNPSDDAIKFGAYLGYHEPLPAEQCQKRYEHYLAGTKPKFWPSGGKIHGLPEKCLNFPGMMMAAFGSRLTPEAAAKYLVKRETKTKPPKLVDHLNHWGMLPGFYKPAELTQQGKYILGFEQWPEQLAAQATGSQALGGAASNAGSASRKWPLHSHASSSSGGAAKKAQGASGSAVGDTWDADVKEKMLMLEQMGKLKEADLDQETLKALKTLPCEVALVCLNKIEGETSRIRDINAFIVKYCKHLRNQWGVDEIPETESEKEETESDDD